MSCAKPIAKGMIPAAWVRFQISPLAAHGGDFDTFASSLGVDPGADWYTPTENKTLILHLIARLGDEHYGHCLKPIPSGASELSLRVMMTAENLSEAIDLLVSFSIKLCPTRDIQKIDHGENFILKFETDGIDLEHAAACELTSMLMYLFALTSFAGEFLPVTTLYTRSTLYSSLMTYNKDADCEVVLADFSGLKFCKASLSIPRRASNLSDPVSNAIRWGLLADKMRPIMDHNHLPLLNAEGLLQQAQAGARTRNVDKRQKRRIALKETEYSARDLEKSIRAAKAMVLISTTNKTISDIGLELGFSDERSLRRFFVDVTGCTPLEYRNVYQEAAASEGRNHFRAILEAAGALRV